MLTTNNRPDVVGAAGVVEVLAGQRFLFTNAKNKRHGCVGTTLSLDPQEELNVFRISLPNFTKLYILFFHSLYCPIFG